MIRTLALLLSLLVGQAHAQGAKQSSPIDTPPSALKPGEFIWSPEAVPAGPLVMVISLDEQRAYVYRNGLRIGVSTVSSGKTGYETPTGVFTILQKHKDHKSNLYDDAPMPFMQRLTWDGVALHAGRLPGYPASHGCVRLPYEFARRLFDVTNFSMTVVVASEAQHDSELVHPGLFAPGTRPVLNTQDVTALPWAQPHQWHPEKSPDGALTVLVSSADQRVLVIRNGVEIGRARINIAPGVGLFGTQAYVLLAGSGSTPSAVVPDRAALRWQSIPMPGYEARAGDTFDSEVIRRISVPPEFAKLVYDALKPGATVVLTDAAVLPKTTGQPMTVISAEQEDVDGVQESAPGAAPPLDDQR